MISGWADRMEDGCISVCLADIKKEMQCPICLSVIKKTRTVMECLHRFCRECIDKAMRLGNNECPACRAHCASRRSLRDDPKFDNLVAALYPNLSKYEEEDDDFDEEENQRNRQIQERITETFRKQNVALSRRRSAGGPGGKRKRRLSRGLKRGRSSMEDEEKEDEDQESLHFEDGHKQDGNKRIRPPRMDPDFITESPDFSPGEDESEPDANAAEDNASRDIHGDRRRDELRKNEEKHDGNIILEETIGVRNKHRQEEDAGNSERAQTGIAAEGWTPTGYGINNLTASPKCSNALLLQEALLSSAVNDSEKELEVHVSICPADDGDMSEDGEECLPPMESCHLCCPGAITVGHLSKFLHSSLSLDPADELELLLPTVDSVDLDGQKNRFLSSSAVILLQTSTLSEIAMSKWKLFGDPVLLYRLKP